MLTKDGLSMKNKKAAAAFILSLSFLLGEMPGKTTPWYLEPIVAGLIVFVESRYILASGIIRMSKKVMNILLMPCFAAVLYTIAGSLIGGDTFAFTLLRSVSTAGQFVYILLLSALLLLVFREDSIDVLCNAMILYYGYSLILALHGMGARGIVQYLAAPQMWNSRTMGNGINYLERHDLGAAVGLLIIHKLFCVVGGGARRITLSRCSCCSLFSGGATRELRCLPLW